MEEVIKTYAILRDSFLNQLIEKLGDVYINKESEVKDIVKFVDYTNSTFNYLIDIIKNYEPIEFKYKQQNSSIDKLLSVYDIMTPFDESKARKTLVNGLIKIVADKWLFDGVFFLKDGNKIRYTDIVKKAILTDNDKNELKEIYKIKRDGLIKEIRKENK